MEGGLVRGGEGESALGEVGGEEWADVKEIARMWKVAR